MGSFEIAVVTSNSTGLSSGGTRWLGMTVQQKRGSWLWGFSVGSPPHNGMGWAGTPLSVWGTANYGGYHVAAFYMENPLVTTDYVTIASQDISSIWGGGCFQIENARVRGDAQTGGGNGRYPSISLSGITPGDMSFDAICHYDVYGINGAGAGQVHHYGSIYANPPWVGAQSSRQPSGDGVMSWDLADNKNYAHIACNFLSYKGGGPRLITSFMQMQDFFKDLKAGLVPPNELRRRYQQVYAI